MAKALIQKLDEVERGHLTDEYLAMAYKPLVIELFRDNSRQMKYDIPVW